MLDVLFCWCWLFNGIITDELSGKGVPLGLLFKTHREWYTIMKHSRSCIIILVFLGLYAPVKDIIFTGKVLLIQLRTIHTYFM